MIQIKKCGQHALPKAPAAAKVAQLVKLPEFVIADIRNPRTGQHLRILAKDAAGIGRIVAQHPGYHLVAG
jgi:hypothetical protein